ncbi:hypothetical protein B0T25DRAFT_491669 [Lasiosphaeria hispida]|uniref:F-box domain-containing protein n=1 Tax=Lasiosphaeria hispida TaxID=260671 RepID=A0AAJ0MJW9_9PEZI|nr:hypothetical protein B0T25DRAFT_491669 [Lasiosphaeria hispida]
MSIRHLPTEIILHICRFLCLHCQLPRVVDAPPCLYDQAASGQKALAHISRSCRRMQDIAQMTLFHWFHSRRCEDGSPDPVQGLESFLQAIIQHPHLARSVEALTFLVPDSYYDYMVFGDLGDIHWDGIYREAVDRVGGGRRRLRSAASEQHESSRPALEDFQDLAIALAPRLSQLCLKRALQYLTDQRQLALTWAGWSHDLANLKYLALPGAEKYALHGTYHMQEVKNLLLHAPNLEVLDAADCACAGDDYYRIVRYRENKPWGVPLARLKKLSLNGINVDEVANMLRECPVVEDLELFNDYENHEVESSVFWRVLRPQTHLRHVRGTLRRLCYSMGTEPIYTRGGDDDDDGDYIGDENIRVILDVADILLEREDDAEGLAGATFASFPVLEVLEIEQIVLYGSIFPIPPSPDEEQDVCLLENTVEDFLGRMPPSIRHLRVGSVVHWPILRRDLAALAQGPSSRSRFPHLEIVTVEVFVAPPRQQWQALADELSTLAIRACLNYAKTGPLSRGLLPSRPAEPEITPKPVLYLDHGSREIDQYT